MRRIIGGAMAMLAAGLGFLGSPWSGSGSRDGVNHRTARNPFDPDAVTPQVTRSKPAPWQRLDDGYKPKVRRRSYKVAVQLCRRQQVGGPTPA